MRLQGHAPLTPLYARTLPPRVLGPAEDCGWVAEVSSESKGGGPACGRELGDPLRSLERLFAPRRHFCYYVLTSVSFFIYFRFLMW